MDELLWLDWVRAELARRRLPPEYCRRLLVELSDHLQTYKEDRSMDAIDHGSVSRRWASRPQSPKPLASSFAKHGSHCAIRS